MSLSHDSAKALCRSLDPLAPALLNTEEISSWLEERRRCCTMQVKQVPLATCQGWHLDEDSGAICHNSGGFFRIQGLRGECADGTPCAQPVIVQPEIGFLGLICHDFEGITHFLVQAKAEPGNCPALQLSPTLQATYSNFTRRHGGKKPPLLDYFLEQLGHEIICDVLQSEQNSRFYRKRNRNIVIKIDEEPELPDTHRWLTLHQLKMLLRQDNLVNMDTRTVLSCLPLSQLPESMLNSLAATDLRQQLIASLCAQNASPPAELTSYFAQQRMFAPPAPQPVPLADLDNWTLDEESLHAKIGAAFEVRFFEVAIEGREVSAWCQPLVAPTAQGLLGLCLITGGDVPKFLVRARAEPGCFDGLEMGPSVQSEPDAPDVLEPWFVERLTSGKGVIYDHLLSEEGGRFYQDHNRCVVLSVPASALPSPLPEGSFLLSYHELNALSRLNNYLNIQLRSLLSTLEI